MVERINICINVASISPNFKNHPQVISFFYGCYASPVMRVLCGSRGESHIATNVDLSTYEIPNGCWLVVFQWLEWFAH